jgi:hypothetical protein
MSRNASDCQDLYVATKCCRCHLIIEHDRRLIMYPGIYLVYFIAVRPPTPLIRSQILPSTGLTCRPASRIHHKHLTRAHRIGTLISHLCNSPSRYPMLSVLGTCAEAFQEYRLMLTTIRIRQLPRDLFISLNDNWTKDRHHHMIRVYVA